LKNGESPKVLLLTLVVASGRNAVCPGNKVEPVTHNEAAFAVIDPIQAPELMMAFEILNFTSLAWWVVVQVKRTSEIKYDELPTTPP